MNIVIPMMGFGTRFSEYQEQKPFIRINTKPLIEHVVEGAKLLSDNIYLVCPHSTKSRLEKMFPDCIVIPLPRTAGAAETLYLACKELDDRPILSVDCDTIIREGFPQQQTQDRANRIYTFKDRQKSGLFSYVIEKAGRVVEIKEKEPISETACSGIYRFSSKEILIEYYQRYSQQEEAEQYTSRLISYCLEQGEVFEIEPVDSFFDCAGTPRQLREYAKSTEKPKILCFDLDRTIIQSTTDNPEPIEETVKFINECYKKGHRIIIHTARGMLSTGSKESAETKYRGRVEEVLTEIGLSYDELIFGKPFADVYVDDKAINGFKELSAEIGIYPETTMNETRMVNKLEIEGGKAVKTGNIIGEAFYYNNIPLELKKHTPKIKSCSKEKIEMEIVYAPDYSSLLLDQEISNDHIRELLDVSERFHAIKTAQKIDANWYYSTKLKDRFFGNERLYDRLGLVEEVKKATARRYMDSESCVIHGDLVFTNVLSKSELSPEIKFIDFRGANEHGYSIYGKECYDHAKILQSLIGYDFALAGEPIPTRYLEELREAYLKEIANRKGEEYVLELPYKTKSLILSMLPCHTDNPKRIDRFVELYRSLK